VKYRYRVAKPFHRALAKLQPDQYRAAVKAYKIFKQNPFDPRLRTHKIHRLSAQYGKTIYSVAIEADLRAVFYIENNTVWSVAIGTHAIYRG
jgi:mRNA-degrading endonuclease YafQ of YafQ-DinJ toxin-antitoxin module